MRTRRSAVATSLIAVIVVVVVVVAAGAYYFALAPGASTSSSSSTTNASTGTTTSAKSSSTTGQSTTTTGSTSSTQTSTSSSSASSQSTSTQTSTAFSCSTTFSTTTGGTVDYTPQYISLVAEFSAITFKVQGTYNGTQSNSTISYSTTTVSSGIYDVSITFTSGTSTESGVARVDSNNQSVISVTFSGYTFRGAQAKSFFDSLFALFGLEYSFGGYVGILTSSTYFHSTGSAQMTFGSTTFSVTTWVANSLPLSINQCGYSSNITAYTLQIGTPPGSTLAFITYLHFASNSPSNEDFTFQLVSMTQA